MWRGIILIALVISATFPLWVSPAETASLLKSLDRKVGVYRSLLVIDTESDWTHIYIGGEIEILNARLTVKMGAEAPSLRYGFNTNVHPVIITINKKQFDTTKVVMHVQLILNITDLFSDVTITVEKGDLRYTRVEVYNSNSDKDILVGAFTNSIAGEGLNTMVFKVPASALADGGPLILPGRAGFRRMIWTFYYPWYYSWQWKGDTILTDHPLIGPYSSSSKDVTEKHIRMAKSSGIDGFIASWWGPGSYTDTNLLIILDAAKKYGFEVSIYLESLVDGKPRRLNELIEWLTYFLSRYGKAEALYRLDGKPVIFIWAAQSHTPAEWSEVFSAVKKNGYDAKYIATVPMDPNHLMYEPSWLDVFDGFHNYGTVGIANLEGIYRRLSMVIRTYSLLTNSSKVILWAPSISPGYDERTIPGRIGLYQPRDDGRYYHYTFRAAIGSDPDWLLVTSWNEFWENTHIEPSKKYGYRYLDLTALFASEFKVVRLSPKIAVLKWADRSTVSLNETLQVQVSIVNKGYGAAINLTARDDLSDVFIVVNTDGQVRSTDRLFIGESLNYTILYRVRERGRFEVPKTNVNFMDIYGNYNFTISSPVYIEVLAPAKLLITGLGIRPEEAKIGETVSISVNVTNIGDLAGEFTITLKINGSIEAVNNIVLSGGRTETLTFNIIRGAVGRYEVEVNGLTGSFMVKAPPAEFRVTELSIRPLEVQAGEAVTITVKVTNIGGKKGSYIVLLEIEGVVVDSKTVTLAGGGSTTVTFVVTREEAGTYRVNIDGQIGKFVVKESVAPLTVEERITYVGFAMLAIAALTITLLLIKRRRYTTS